MPLLSLRLHLTDWRRLSEEADAKGIALLEQFQFYFQLGLAAADAGWQPGRATDSMARDLTAEERATAREHLQAARTAPNLTTQIDELLRAMETFKEAMPEVADLILAVRSKVSLIAD